MKEVFENDDEIRDLIRKEGLLSAPPDFTSGIMQLISEPENEAGFAYKPLLSKTAWTVITAGTLLVVLVCWLILSIGTPENQVLPDVLKSMADFVTRIDLTVHFNPTTLFIATLAFASFGILLLLDLWFTGKSRESAI